MKPPFRNPPRDFIDVTHLGSSDREYVFAPMLPPSVCRKEWEVPSGFIVFPHALDDACSIRAEARTGAILLAMMVIDLVAICIVMVCR
jgi:hypothetical protein